MEEYCTHLAEYFGRENGSNAAQSNNFLLLVKLPDNTLHFGVHLHVSPLADKIGIINSFFFFTGPTSVPTVPSIFMTVNWQKK
jgi:hypothetical protein